MNKTAITLALTLFSASCATHERWDKDGQLKAQEMGNIRALCTFDDNIYLAGQVPEPAFKMLAEKGVKKVINLRTDQEMQRLGFDEKAVVESVGMEYIRVPFGMDGASDADVQKILVELDRANKEPVLLHCAAAVRVGYIWSMYRATKSGLSEEAAIEEGKKVGLRSSAPLEKKAREYIGRAPRR